MYYTSVQRRDLDEADCPICYESLAEEPLVTITFCRTCGNNVHQVHSSNDNGNLANHDDKKKGLFQQVESTTYKTTPCCDMCLLSKRMETTQPNCTTRKIYTRLRELCGRLWSAI